MLLLLRFLCFSVTVALLLCAVPLVLTCTPCFVLCTSCVKLQPCFCHVPSNGQQCQCGGPRKEHQSVALGDYFSTAMVTHWNSAQHSSESATDAFGEVEFDGASKRHSCVSEHRVGYCISQIGRYEKPTRVNEVFWLCYMSDSKGIGVICSPIRCCLIQ